MNSAKVKIKQPLANIIRSNRSYCPDTEELKSTVVQHQEVDDPPENENTLSERMAELLANIQPKGLNSALPLFNQLNQSLALCLTQHEPAVHITTLEFASTTLSQLNGYKALLADLEKRPGIVVTNSKPYFSSSKINLEFLLFKIEKLIFLSKEIISFCNALIISSRRTDPYLILTELMLLVNQIENQPSNPDLEEYTSRLGKALTLAARTSTDDLNPILENFSHPQVLNGVIAGVAAGDTDIIGSFLSTKVSVFKRLNDKINKNILLMKEALLLNCDQQIETAHSQVWSLLEPRIDKILSKHTNYTSALLCQKTKSQRIRQRMLESYQRSVATSSPSQLDQSSQTSVYQDSKLAYALLPLISEVLQIEEILTVFTRSPQDMALHQLQAAVEAVLAKIVYWEDARKSLVYDYLWKVFNSAKYYHRQRHEGLSIRQLYRTPLDFMLTNGYQQLVQQLTQGVSGIKELIHSDYSQLYVTLRELLENTSKRHVIRDVCMVRIVLDNNSKLNATDKLNLYTTLFNHRLDYSHGNLHKLANSQRKDSTQRKLITDFLRYSLHNTATIGALTQDNELATQLSRWNAFQFVGNLGKSRLTDNLIERSHTANSVAYLYQLGLEYLQSHSQGQGEASTIETRIETFERRLRQNDISSLSLDSPAPLRHGSFPSEIKTSRVLHLTHHQEHLNQADIDQDVVSEILYEELVSEDEIKAALLLGNTSLQQLEPLENLASINLSKWQLLEGSSAEFANEEEKSASLEDLGSPITFNRHPDSSMEQPETVQPPRIKNNLYQFSRLQDLSRQNLLNQAKPAILPNIVHLILAQQNQQDKAYCLKNFYELAKFDPQLAPLFTYELENASITEFDKLVLLLLGQIRNGTEFIQLNPLVSLCLLFACVSHDLDEERRAEKLYILNDLIENLHNSDSVLFTRFNANIFKTFLIELTISCVSASLYGFTYTLTFPVAIALQLFLNWIRMAANDARTISIVSRKMIKTNREKALKKIAEILKTAENPTSIELEIHQHINNQLSEFYADISRLDIAKYTQKAADRAQSNSSQQLLQNNQERLAQEAQQIIYRLELRINAKNLATNIILFPLEFLFLVDDELHLQESINRNSLIRKLLLLRQIIEQVKFAELTSRETNEYKSILLASMLICLRNGLLAPQLRQNRAKLYDAFVARENLLISFTALLPKITNDLMYNVTESTLLGSGGDSGGVLASNLLKQRKRHPKGYRRVMKMFKTDLLNRCRSLDFMQNPFSIEARQLADFIKRALNIHTNNKTLWRWGNTASAKEFAAILHDKKIRPAPLPEH